MNIERKQKELEKIKENLKSYFIGIDKQIDEIINHITVWYCAPELLEKPTIINLWGMTGVGKTDLVRKLVTELKMINKYIEYNIKDVSMYTRDLHIELLISGIGNDDPAVILIDEIQRMVSLRNNTNFVSSLKLWDLLSDGRVTSKKKKLDELEYLHGRIQKITDYDNNNQSQAFGFADYKHLAYYTDLTDDDMDFFIKSRFMKSKTDSFILQEYIKDIDPNSNQSFYLMKFISDKFKKRNITTSSDVFELIKNKHDKTRFVQLLKRDEIMYLLETKIDLLWNSSIDGSDKDVYKKLLIFTCGNLDNVYEEAVDINASDKADEIFEKTSGITIDEIKLGLMEFFKPEEVARLGNNHVIYSSLSSNAFKTIIEKEILKSLQNILDKFEIRFNINVDDFVNWIFHEYVSPTQGIRPIFTTVSSVISHFVPKFIMYSKQSKCKEIDVELTYDDEMNAVITTNINGEEMSVRLHTTKPIPPGVKRYVQTNK